MYCEKNNIKFTYIADGEIISFMEYVDISVLIGNLLDNAIECVVKYENEEKRIISFSLTRKNETVHLVIENYCEDTLSFYNGIPITTKKDKHSHGFGIKSSEIIVEKYGGFIGFNQERNLFKSIAVIPLIRDKS